MLLMSAVAVGLSSCAKESLSGSKSADVISNDSKAKEITIEDITGTVVNADGDTVEIDNLQFLLESALREALNSSDSKTASSNNVNLEDNNYAVTDENGDTVQLDSQIIEAIMSKINEIVNENL